MWGIFCVCWTRSGEKPLTRSVEGSTNSPGANLVAGGARRVGAGNRSPTGTGVSARLAVLHARGLIEAGAPLIAESLIGSRFIGRIEAVARVGECPAVIPTVEGHAWITGTSQLFCDVDDPWPEGYRINDTWPDAQFFP